jgi:uncharacterized protein YjiS (DUF1127 family)
MVTTTITAEIAKPQGPTQHLLDIERYRQGGRQLRALQWRRPLKRAAAGICQALHVGASYAWCALCIARSTIARERERSAYRRALQALNPRILQDIGLHRSEISWALDTLSTTGKLSRLSAWSVRD